MSISGEALVGRERVQLASVRLRQPERRQMAMVVACLDDLVTATHPVRMLQAVVERLDLEQFYEPIQARQGVAGRDATDPRLLVALWLYACTCGMGSARELARRSADSAAFRWLCGGVTVNHRLLSNFRTDHGAALDALFTQVIASLVDKDVVRVSRVSQDGVRVGAGAASFCSEERLRSCSMKRASMSPSCARRWTRRSIRRSRRGGGRRANGPRPSGWSGWSKPSRSCRN